MWYGLSVHILYMAEVANEMGRNRARKDTSKLDFTSTKCYFGDLRGLSPRQYVLYDMTYPVCKPRIHMSHFVINSIDISLLNSNCTFCNIILRCHTRFFGEDHRAYCKIVSGEKLSVILCFRKNEYSCLRDHVQLYSTGECLADTFNGYESDAPRISQPCKSFPPF